MNFLCITLFETENICRYDSSIKHESVNHISRFFFHFANSSVSSHIAFCFFVVVFIFSLSLFSLHFHLFHYQISQWLSFLSFSFLKQWVLRSLEIRVHLSCHHKWNPSQVRSINIRDRAESYKLEPLSLELPQEILWGRLCARTDKGRSARRLRGKTSRAGVAF